MSLPHLIYDGLLRACSGISDYLRRYPGVHTWVGLVIRIAVSWFLLISDVSAIGYACKGKEPFGAYLFQPSNLEQKVLENPTVTRDFALLQGQSFRLKPPHLTLPNEHTVLPTKGAEFPLTMMFYARSLH